ncbi:MAG: hypothetical protein VB138_08525, partial [Burkholderia sp.]
LLTGASPRTVARKRHRAAADLCNNALTMVLTRLASRYGDFLSPEVRETMTVAAYRAGALKTVEIPGVHRIGEHRSGCTLQSNVDAMLGEMTDRHGFPRSATAARLFVRRDTH